MITKKVQRISPDGEIVVYDSITQAAKSTPGSHRELIGRAVRLGRKHRGYLWEPANGSPLKPQSTTMAMSEEQLRSMFDIRAIVLSELQKIKPDEFWRDGDFVKRFQGRSGFRSALESPEAQPYKGKASGQVFWGHPDSIDRMKSEGVLI